MKVYGYARTSTGNQDLGLEKQEKEIEKICEEKGYGLKTVYKNQVSGMKKITGIVPTAPDSDIKDPSIDLEARPKLREMFYDAQEENIEKIIVYKPSRLGRRVRPKLLIEHLFSEIGVEIEYIEVPESWVGRMIEHLMEEKEVREIRQRTKKGLEQKDPDEWKGRPPTGFKTVEEHNKLEPEEWLEDLVKAQRNYINTNLSRKLIAEQFKEEVTPTRMRSLEKNIQENIPEKSKVKGERPYQIEDSAEKRHKSTEK
jgi:DNA invertase Pin-like site-specific DNA recombinase